VRREKKQKAENKLNQGNLKPEKGSFEKEGGDSRTKINIKK